MEGKKSFIVYTSWYDFLEDLSNEQKGMWLDWMMRYTNDEWDNKEIVYPTDPMVKMACKMVKDTLKRDLDSWKEQKAKRSEAGKKGMAIRWHSNDIANDNTTITKDNSVINANNKDITKITDNVNVNVNVNDNVNVSKENSIKEKPTSRFNQPTLEDIKIYCLERNNLVDAERFYDFYSSKGWMVGKNKMKDWKAAIRTWEKEAGFKNPNEATPQQLMTGGFEILSNEIPSATPYEVANDIKAMHLTPNQVEQWLSSYTDDFAQEVRKHL